ncbi:methyl-accepting chemotaxis sensory transducer with Cache sensor [Selenomonas ruminantium]|uniref:Methyl-accepting chemotaxis sensory transducer with Cache sensor n=1 Tax=Selenomonas ruminantium TaxID=971 RepID=A0A1M6VLK2_SELRU|nr:methyl-accepting chemotaxis protein [Selenomonas ruminantium]SHK82225.1 methyl-accepting chemotaxis sensory transducer with Cache sensor [Selenomonas ruminantium]
MSNEFTGTFHSVKLKMCLSLLPPIIIGLTVLTVLVGYSSYDSIANLTEQSTYQTIKANALDIHERLTRMRMVCENLAGNIETDCLKKNQEELAKEMADGLKNEEMANGGGVWFEPFAHTPNTKYVCPFIFRENGTFKVSYDYVAESGDYLPTDWYKMGKAAHHGEAAMTELPYYDPSAKVMMVTYTSPLYTSGKDGKFIGNVTVDISLASIAEMVSGITIGGKGYAILTAPDGTYIAGVSQEKLNGETNAIQDENASFAAAMKQMVSSQEGKTQFEDEHGEEMFVYYQTVPDLNWHFGVIIPRSELYADANHLIMMLAGIAVLVLFLLMLMAYRTVSNFAERIGIDQKFAEDLAEGNYARSEAVIQSNDEIGRLGDAINRMFRQTKKVLHAISDHSSNMNTSSRTLEVSAEKLTKGIDEIQHKMTYISDAMMNASSATEEVNASVEDVASAVNLLSNEAANGLKQAEDVRLRAEQVERNSVEASRSAEKLAKEFSANLAASIDKARTVEQIGTMAAAISGIAEQINLLSLNASIEAARAGESGRGFTVVAMEVGKLAKETADTVEEIQQNIHSVQEAFASLSDDAKAILGFLNDTVAPQYDEFVGIAEQYGADAEVFRTVSQKIAETSRNVNDTMEQVSKAMLQIANSAEETAALSVEISGSVSNVSESVKDVDTISQQQSSIAESLLEAVKHFKLKQ